jgi:hypothetical protein
VLRAALLANTLRVLGHLGATLLLAVACAPYAELRQAARSGDRRELHALLKQKQAAHKLNSHGLRRTALALLEGEIERAQGEDGGARLAALSNCVSSLETPLATRAQKTDTPGGVAALLLQEEAEGRRSIDEAWKAAVEPHFRATYARSLRDPKSVRTPFLRDPDPEVRRAALDAALDALAAERGAGDGHSPNAGAGQEFSEMAAISRSDPDTLCRSKALTWLGRSAFPEALQVLVERFQEGDEKIRLLALGALYQKAQHEAEAQDLLYELGVVQPGRVGIEAAFFVLHLPELDTRGTERGDHKQEPSRLFERKIRADAKLLEAARYGALDERSSIVARHAIDSRAWLEVLQAATDPAGGALAVVALGRLLSLTQTHADAERKLLAYSPQINDVGRLARQTLAERGNLRVVPILERHREHRDLELRREAARNLLALGREQSVAPLLADDDASLRIEVACTLLAR